MRSACHILSSFLLLLAFLAMGTTVFAPDAHADVIDAGGIHAQASTSHAGARHDSDAASLECPAEPGADFVGYDGHCSAASGGDLMVAAASAWPTGPAESPIDYRSRMRAAATIPSLDRPPRRI